MCFVEHDCDERFANVARGQFQQSPMGELNLEWHLEDRAYLQTFSFFRTLFHGTRWMGGRRRGDWLLGLGTDQWSRG